MSVWMSPRRGRTVTQVNALEPVANALEPVMLLIVRSV